MLLFFISKLVNNHQILYEVIKHFVTLIFYKHLGEVLEALSSTVLIIFYVFII